MDVEPAGNFQNILLSLEAEVTELCNNLSAEVLISLLDKWENDIAHDRVLGQADMEELLSLYVKMKVTLHHMNKQYFREDYWSSCSPSGLEFKKRIDNLLIKTKEARRKYYVAKRRAEGEHGNDCTCRGCKCLGQDG